MRSPMLVAAMVSLLLPLSLPQSGASAIADTAPFSSEKKLTASDASEGDGFGSSVSISDETIVVGAPNDDDGGSTSGSAYVFKRKRKEQAKLTAGDAAPDDRFGSSVSISSKTIVVGALGDDDWGSFSGAAYVFRHQAGAWVNEGKLTASDAAPGDQFGASVAVSDETIVVGAFFSSTGSPRAGAAYVFQREGGVWVQRAKLTASDAEADDLFGRSVAIGGRTIVVGAVGDDDGGSASGAAYVFKRQRGVWVQQAKLTAGDAEADDFFGFSVSISRATIVVGAHASDDAGSASGAAYVFKRQGGVWLQQAKLTASDAAAEDLFGISVSISAATIVVGARGDDTELLNGSGAAYVFRRKSGARSRVLRWVQQAKLTASGAAHDDQFASSVSISSTTIVVGTPNDDAGGSDSGSAYVFE